MKKRILATMAAVVVALSAPMSVSAAWQRHHSGHWQWHENGSPKTGWVQDRGHWYCLNSAGMMETGWVRHGGCWYYLDPSSGAMKTGWVCPGGCWYYLDDSGAMQTGWVRHRGNWYYLDSSGAMRTGWLQQGNKRYYLKSDGSMATGQLTIEGKSYTFASSGELLEGGDSSFGDPSLPVDPLWKGTVSGGTLPAMGDAATSDNVLALLDRYDPNGAFILRKSGDSWLFWFSGSSLLERVDTAVHESCHTLSFQGGFSYGGWRDNFYTGGGTMVPVAQTQVFDSREMIPAIPERLQNTPRFSTYVGTSNGQMASVQSGIYGLMNEYTAYSWGMNNTVSLFDYYLEKSQTADDWFQYINLGANDRLAYGEFRYYILTYLLYAKENYPQVYQGILQNQDFKKAFRLVDDTYTRNVARFEESLSRLERELDGAEITDGYFMIGWGGMGLFESDYKALTDAISTPEYQAALAELKG